MKMTREERGLRRAISPIRDTVTGKYFYPFTSPRKIPGLILAMRNAVIEQERERCALKIDDLLRRAANCEIGMPRTDIVAAIRKGTK